MKKIVFQSENSKPVILFDDDKRQISYFKKYHVSCTTIVVKPPEKNIPASVFCTIDVLKNSELSEDFLK